MTQSENKKKGKLTEGDVGKLLFKLTVPMIFGILSLVVFNLVDTFFVGQLGTAELAALSFTFPVVLVVGSLAIGLGIGASAVISRAIGEGNHHKVRRFTTDSLILSMLFVAFFVILGLLTIDPLFRLLGATDEVLPLVKEYMTIWYLGVFFVIIPMVGNNAIRAMGDTKTPSMIMMTAAAVNLILDPLFIFGIGPFPRLELTGAAITTVVARAVALVISLYVLIHRENMITFRFAPIKDILDSWKRILYIGLPAAGTRLIIPVAIGVITGLIATYGAESVAAFGVATRIEFFALSPIMALASVIGPFVGQNWGAGIFDRVKSGVKYSQKFCVFWGLAIFVFLFVFARPIASLFNSNPEVISKTALYLLIVPVGFGMQGVTLLSTSALNVLNKPLHALILIIMQMFMLYIPLSFVGSYMFGIKGIFSGIVVSYLTAGAAGYILLKKIIFKIEKAELSN